MTKEQRELEAKLRELSEAALVNQRLVREAFFNYEKFLAIEASLEASMQALRSFKEQRRRNSSEDVEPSPTSVAKRAPKAK